MKWIKLSDELPQFDTEIVLLSERGFTRLASRETQERMDMLDAKIYDIARRLGVKKFSSIYDTTGLPRPSRLEYKWKYWCLLPDKPLKQKTEEGEV